MRLRAFGIAYRADLFKFYTRLDCCLILRVGTREKKKKNVGALLADRASKSARDCRISNSGHFEKPSPKYVQKRRILARRAIFRSG